MVPEIIMIFVENNVITGPARGPAPISLRSEHSSSN